MAEENNSNRVLSYKVPEIDEILNDGIYNASLRHKNDDGTPRKFQLSEVLPLIPDTYIGVCRIISFVNIYDSIDIWVFNSDDVSNFTDTSKWAKIFPVESSSEQSQYIEFIVIPGSQWGGIVDNQVTYELANSDEELEILMGIARNGGHIVTKVNLTEENTFYFASSNYTYDRSGSNETFLVIMDKIVNDSELDISISYKIDIVNSLTDGRIQNKHITITQQRYS